MERKKGKAIIVFLVIVLIVCALGMILLNKINDKSYKLEEVAKFSYFKLYEDGKYGVIDITGKVLVPAKYEMLEIPNPSKAVFIGYTKYDATGKDYQTEVINDKNEKILTEYIRSKASYV